MAFMEPDYYQGIYFTWETREGIFFSPDSPDREQTDGATVEQRTGILFRLSAPGYMDCTDWTPADSMDEARAELSAMHDVCADCGDDLDETDGDAIQCGGCREDSADVAELDPADFA